MSYQFGTNWSRFSEIVGNVIGPQMGYEVLTAFFLEATFLGIMLFGFNRVAPWLHALSAVMVAFGTLMSAFWILSANSWMHTPDGFAMKDGIAYPVDWSRIIFNPSFPYRLAHMLNATYLTVALVVLSTGARFQLAGSFAKEARTLVHLGLGAMLVLAPMQLFIGDQHGLNSLEHQPAKIAAIEAHWDGSHPGALLLVAVPDAKNERNSFEIGIPGGASLVLKHDVQGLFPGLRDFKPEDRPPVARVFYAFRLMVGIGLTMIAFALAGGWLWWRGRLLTTRWYLHTVGYSWPLGFIAIISGWIVTESGRQPWIVQGVLRTADASSPVSAGAVATSLALFVLVYGVVFSIGIYFIRRMLQKGPAGAAATPPPAAPLAHRPIAAAGDAAREAAHSDENAMRPTGGSPRKPK
jgi:cytochrome d ubiquinol oxidase subunit I